MVLHPTLQLRRGLLLHPHGFLLQGELRGVVGWPVEVGCRLDALGLVLVGLVAVGVVVPADSTHLRRVIHVGQVLTLGSSGQGRVRVCGTPHLLEDLGLVELALQVLRVLKRGGPADGAPGRIAGISLGGLVQLADVSDPVVGAQLGARHVPPTRPRGQAEVGEAADRRGLLVDIHGRVLVQFI